MENAVSAVCNEQIKVIKKNSSTTIVSSGFPKFNWKCNF